MVWSVLEGTDEGFRQDRPATIGVACPVDVTAYLESSQDGRIGVNPGSMLLQRAFG